jgi:hypothetical protein
MFHISVMYPDFPGIELFRWCTQFVYVPYTSVYIYVLCHRSNDGEIGYVPFVASLSLRCGEWGHICFF